MRATPRPTTLLLLLSIGCGAAPASPPPRAREGEAPAPLSRTSEPTSAAVEVAAIPRCTAAPESVGELDAAPSLSVLAPATPLVRAPTPSSRGEPIGRAVPGFVWWASANGRFALLMQFEGGTLQFGHHGEVFGARPSLSLVDVTQGTTETVDDLIAPAPGGTAVAVRDSAGRIVIVRQAGERIDVSALGADARGDENRCLHGRQVGFDDSGRFASFVVAPDAIVVRELESGAQCRVEVTSPLVWRTAPGSTPGWLLVRSVTRDEDHDGRIGFPQQSTSCACRWCNRFALSYGFYGWSGDGFESTWIAPNGTRIASDGVEVPVGDEALARADAETRTIVLVSSSGASIVPPDGCDIAALVPGAPSVLLRCGASSKLFFPEGARVLDLPALIDAAGIASGLVTREAHVWAPVLARDAQGNARLSRLRMNDGRVEAGPSATELVTLDGEWAIARRDGGLALLDVADGRARTVDLAGVETVLGLVVRTSNGRSVLLGPDVARWVDVEVEIDAADERGCALVPDGRVDRGLAQGPWRRVCP